MEDKLVSKHILDASQYEGKGKWKGVIQGWVVFLIIYGITRIPNVQQAMLDFANSMKGVAWLSSGVNFIIHGLWIIAILSSMYFMPSIEKFSASTAAQAGFSIFWVLLLIIIYLVKTYA